MNIHNPARGTSTGSLAGRAMILSLSIKMWSGRRLDREVTQEVNDQHGASDYASRVNKLLVKKSALEPIQKVASETRAEFLKCTLPWMNEGGRIMSMSKYFDVVRMVSDNRVRFEAAVDDFIANYPRHMAEGAAELGSMYRPDDYPTPDQLRDRYAMKVTTMPVPKGEDFRVDMGDSTVARIREEIEAEVMEATARAVREVYARVAEVTGAMATKLRKYKPAEGRGTKSEGVFRDSLVSNIGELIDLMPALNIAGDPQIDALARSMRDLVQYDAKTLREDEGKRADQADAAQDIFDAVSGYLA